jgi:4-alpha-glucanotransferase
VGTLGELASLGSWVAERGGCFVATTPLLAAFLEEPFEPSPYLPVTRLFWNELYADLPPSAASVPNTGDRVDYRQAFKTAREAARRGAACFFSSGSPEERARLAAYVEEKPEVLDYAHFRARVDREGCDWRRWRGEGVAHAEQAGTAARLKAVRSMLAEPSAATEKGDVDECEQVYLWWQWVTDSHLHALGSREDFSLSLDFPLGVHPGGFDTWRHPECFVGGASVGAPPDTFFREGQDWATPPLHPGALAGAGLDYLAGCLRTHMRVAGKLRIDHVMGLHRQYWIPDGAPATQGVYVNYPADLLYAVVALESMRAGCVVVGEDLGTVPPLVRPAMRRHGVRRTFVLQLEVPAPALRRSLAAASIALPAPAEAPTLRTGPGRVEAGDPRPSPDLPRPPKLATAMLNTHDLPPFAAYMRGDGGDDVHAGAEASLFAQLRAALLYLAGSEAEDVQINLEDLWLETDPQNTPGRTDAGLNWQRRVRLSLDELAAADGIRRLLGEVSRARASDSG